MALAMALESASEVDCGCCGGADGWQLEDVVWVGGCGTGSEVRCDRAWRERSCATRSDESLAALTARVGDCEEGGREGCDGELLS